jgi:RHS repeat-associated protein
MYDGANPYADFDGSGSLTYRYLFGPAVDMILARMDASDDVAWYLTDHLGSVRDIADLTGTVIDHIQYDSFGNILSETNPTAGDRFKFTGREYDEATAQYYYRARYYDPAVGRFIAEDPLRLAAGDANLYRYVRNQPTANTDPSGMSGGMDGGSGGMIPPYNDPLEDNPLHARQERLELRKNRPFDSDGCVRSG